VAFWFLLVYGACYQYRKDANCVMNRKEHHVIYKTISINIYMNINILMINTGGNRTCNTVTFLPRRRKFVHLPLSFLDQLVFGSFVDLDLAVAASGIDRRLALGLQCRDCVSDF